MAVAINVFQNDSGDWTQLIDANLVNANFEQMGQAIRVNNLKMVKNGAAANQLDIFAKSTGALPTAAAPIQVAIPDGNGVEIRTRSAEVKSGLSKITLADAQGYWGSPSLNGSSYRVYVYAIWSAADSGIIWAVSGNPCLKMVATTATVTNPSFMLLEGASTYSKQATDYCVLVGAFNVEYDTADAPDYTINSATLDVVALPELNVASGVYTPTLTNSDNVASSTAYLCSWSRIGNVVTATIRCDIDPTAAAPTNTLLIFSLPVACTASPTVIGCAACNEFAEPGRILVASSSTAYVYFSAVNVGVASWAGTYQYVLN